MERRCQGLCYNCDEPYVRGHQCQRLFFLEVSDYMSDGEDDATAGDTSAQPAAEADPVVSLHAIAGIRTEDTMMVPVYIHGHRLTALLDSGSMHNFIHVHLISRMGLVTSGPNLRVTVANGDRVLCGVVARNIACNSWISVIELFSGY